MSPIGPERHNSAIPPVSARPEAGSWKLGVGSWELGSWKLGAGSWELGRLSQISDLRSQISDLRSQISDLRSQISNLKSQISNLRSQISDLKSQISNQKSPITNHQSSIPAAMPLKLINFAKVARPLLPILEVIARPPNATTERAAKRQESFSQGGRQSGAGPQRAARTVILSCSPQTMEETGGR